jgi:hypothetical protein
MRRSFKRLHFFMRQCLARAGNACGADIYSKKKRAKKATPSGAAWVL